MKRLLFILMIACVAQTMRAQAPKRQAEKQAVEKSNTDNMTTRAQISFPVEATMSEDVVWRRDVYRELNLTQDENAGLYYPVEPVGSQMNLFTYIFKLVMRGQVPAYEYRLDGNESFEQASRIKPLEFLKDKDIFFERTDRGIHIDDSDIPSREVKLYFVKESAYYDQATATFHTQVIALCPVMMRDDDFGDGATKTPLFWVKYSDLAPFLAKQTIMASNLNNAATMSTADFFTMNHYRGKIYKTNNMLGRTLSEYCKTDSAMTFEQKRIEKEITAFEKNMWGDQARKDSLDSIAKLDKKDLKVSKKRNRRAGGTSTETTVRKTRRSSSGGSSSGSAARVTVRRERH
jgi:gliding motility associated protien GldN